MSRVLNGAELAEFIMDRQARQVRNLKQEHHTNPRLVVLMSDEASESSSVYVRMKQRYADDIGVVVDVIHVPETELITQVTIANNDSNTHGIIVQLPLKEVSQTEEICNKIDSNKDVDGLGNDAIFTGATAEAIDWLLAGYNVNLPDKKITLLGYGKLVGQPLEKLWRAQGREVTVVDIDTIDPRSVLQESDIIIAATGVPRRLTSEDVKHGAVVVDAGTASEGGVLVGDIDESLRARTDVSMTPQKGGVGPLTIAVLFDHVIQAALKQASTH